MKSVVERALGDEFKRLHPQIQRQYGLKSTDGLACRGEGVMEEVWRGRFFMVPFLQVGAMRRVMFPDTGTNIAFTVENYAYVDRFGRETITWNRTFDFRRPRRFDETLIFSEARQRPVVYAGTHQHLAVDLELSVDDDGAFRLRTGEQRLYEWRVGVPFPMLLSGYADVRESYSDERERFEVGVDIRSSVWGRIFGYRGWFTLEWIECPRIPTGARPVREEVRE